MDWSAYISSNHLWQPLKTIIMKHTLGLIIILLIAGCVRSSYNKTERSNSSGDGVNFIVGTFKSKEEIPETVIFTKRKGNSYKAEFNDGNKAVGMLHGDTLNLPLETKFVFSKDYNEAEHFHLNGSRMFYRVKD